MGLSVRLAVARLFRAREHALDRLQHVCRERVPRRAPRVGRGGLARSGPRSLRLHPPRPAPDARARRLVLLQLHADRSCVHNANLLGAALLARVARETGEDELREQALAAARFTLRAQAPDGSWPYGNRSFQTWIDNFHTGFNLVALAEIIDATGEPELADPLRRGYAFYRDTFFLADGTPKYYHDRLYPVDIHSAAQALVTFAALAPLEPGALSAGQLVAQWTLREMRDRGGRFYFQKQARYTNRTSFIRWSQAWMLYGLARLMAAMTAVA
jgi:hypothetical protein